MRIGKQIPPIVFNTEKKYKVNTVNLKVVLRRLFRNREYFFINLIGLTVSLASILLIGYMFLISSLMMEISEIRKEPTGLLRSKINLG